MMNPKKVKDAVTPAQAGAQNLSGILDSGLRRNGQLRLNPIFCETITIILDKKYP